MTRLLWICLGGAVGTGARYLLGGWLARALGPAFPWGTLAVNAIGSFLLAAIMHVGLATEALSADARVVLTIGVLGGFTTYSTFNFETMAYLRDGAVALGALNLAATVVGCLAAGAAGLAAARWLTG